MAFTNPGNDILAVSGSSSNFAFGVQFSDVDMASQMDNLKEPVINISYTDIADWQVALPAQGAVNLTGVVNVSLSQDICINVTHLCYHLSEGKNASYVDANTTNNVICINITQQKGCDPGKFIYIQLHNPGFKHYLGLPLKY